MKYKIGHIYGVEENGNKLVGRVIEIEEKSQQYVVKWSDGEVTFETSLDAKSTALTERSKE